MINSLCCTINISRWYTFQTFVTKAASSDTDGIMIANLWIALALLDDCCIYCYVSNQILCGLHIELFQTLMSGLLLVTGYSTTASRCFTTLCCRTRLLTMQPIINFSSLLCNQLGQFLWEVPLCCFPFLDNSVQCRNKCKPSPLYMPRLWIRYHQTQDQ